MASPRRAALDAHLGHDHTVAFLRVAPGLVAGEPVLSFYEVPTATDGAPGPVS